MYEIPDTVVTIAYIPKTELFWKHLDKTTDYRIIMEHF